MPATLAEIRARAQEHADEIESVKWLTTSELAARWRVSETLVRQIPIEALRYKAFGGVAAKIHRRRYREDWVSAYEEGHPQIGAAGSPGV